MKKIILFAFVFLVGCGADRMWPSEMKQAEEMCADHGGVRYAETRHFHNLTAYCKDGTEISQPIKKEANK